MKTRFPRSVAMVTAAEICRVLKPVTERLIVAGSLRRGCPDVGDIEILYIPKMGSVRDLFNTYPVNYTDGAIDLMVNQNVLAHRAGTEGRRTGWGEKNKFAIHISSGIPVDFFATTDAAWFNYLVCRTGPAELNTLISSRAREKGYRWAPYDAGFWSILSAGDGAKHFAVTSEADVFTFVDLPPMTPTERQAFKEVAAGYLRHNALPSFAS